MSPCLSELCSPAARGLFGLCLATSLFGCSRGDRPSTPDSTVRILYPDGDVRIFAPEWDDAPKFLLYQPLAGYQATNCGAPDPDLAERWQASEDRRTWTVTLRRDARWDDGVPVTAEDIVFNLRLWKDPDVAWYGGAPVDSAEALDEHTVRIHLHAPGAWPLEGWDVFYPKHMLDTIPPRGFFSTDFWNHPVGDGPYRFVRQVPKTMVELEANPDFWGGAPRIRHVILQFQAGSGSSVVELRAGNVDMAAVDPLEAGVFAHDNRYRIYYRLAGTADWLMWNVEDARLRDARVRRAFAHAVDRRLLLRTLNLPDSLPITDAPYVACQMERHTMTPAWPHDTAEAVRLLRAAGWWDADGDGVREWHGPTGDSRPTPSEPLRFTVLTTKEHEAEVVFVKDQLRRVGADMEIRILDPSLVHQRFMKGEFEAIVPPSAHAEQVYPAGGTAVGAPDTVLARLLEAAKMEPDFQRQAALYRALGERYRDVAPALFLELRVGVLVADRRIRGIGEPGTLISRPTWRWPFGGLQFLWIDADK